MVKHILKFYVYLLNVDKKYVWNSHPVLSPGTITKVYRDSQNIILLYILFIAMWSFGL